MTDTESHAKEPLTQDPNPGGVLTYFISNWGGGAPIYYRLPDFCA